MAKFMLFMRGFGDYAQNMSPEQMQKTLGQYNDWTAKLQREGKFIDANQLNHEGSIVRSNGNGLVLDGPYTETKEYVGGYYLIEAADFATAAEAAKGCPHLVHGGEVEVREIVVM